MGTDLIERFSNGNYYTITIHKDYIHDLVPDHELKYCETKEDIDKQAIKRLDSLIREYNWED